MDRDAVLRGAAGPLSDTDATGGGEFAAITRIARRLEGQGVGRGEVWIGDDAAVVGIGSGRVVIAADALVVGVHADLALTTIADLGWKALAVNVSDLAAMGCVASRAVVTVSGPPDTDIDGLYDGLAQAAVAMACPIVGGDLTGAPRLVVSVTVIGDGDVTPPPVLRSGARSGDTIWASGPLGGAAAGLRALQAQAHAQAQADGQAGEADPVLARRHARPEARVAQGVRARELGATAMIDVSDGFAADLAHLLDASGVGCHLDEVPVHPGATGADALGGGDDYELVWTCPVDVDVIAAFEQQGLPVPIRVGRCVDDPADRRLAGAPLPTMGWQHDIGSPG